MPPRLYPLPLGVHMYLGSPLTSLLLTSPPWVLDGSLAWREGLAWALRPCCAGKCYKQPPSGGPKFLVGGWEKNRILRNRCHRDAELKKRRHKKGPLR